MCGALRSAAEAPILTLCKSFDGAEEEAIVLTFISRVVVVVVVVVVAREDGIEEEG